ncbi:hypothetical protein, partial [Enterobacter intestinihominis]
AAGEHVDGEGQVRAANRLPVAGVDPQHALLRFFYFYHQHPRGDARMLPPHTIYLNNRIKSIHPAD